MAYRAGQAFIAVAPSFKGFQLAAAAEAKKLRPIKIPVKYDMPDLPPVAVGKPVKIKAELDQGAFERGVKTKLRAAIASLPKTIGMEADAHEAERQIASLRTQLETLSKQRIGIDMHAEQALNELNYIKTELERLGAASPNVQVRADAAAAAAQLAAVQAEVEKLDASHPTVKPDADTAGATSKLTFLSGLADKLDGKTVRIRTVVTTVGALGALPALGVGAGALGGVAALGGAALAGVATAAVIGTASIKKALGLQKQLTQADKNRVTAIAGVKSAQASLASAESSVASAQISAARGVKDAQVAVADARRNVARVAQQSARQITAAEENVAQAEYSVKQALDAVHQARLQAAADIADLQRKQDADARSIEGAQIAYEEAQQRLIQVQKTAAVGSLELRQAQLDVANAAADLSDAQRQQVTDQQALTKAQKDGVSGAAGVKSATHDLAEAQLQAKDAQTALRDAHTAAAQARADAARAVARAETQLSRARTDGARSVAQAQAQVAEAQRRLAAAQAKVTDTDKKRLAILAQMGPMQDKIIAGVKALGLAWDKLIFSKPVTGAALAGIGAAKNALPGLSNFVRPVAKATGSALGDAGKALGSPEAKQFASVTGVFTGKVVKDAEQGTKGLAIGFGNLFKAFMPMALGMSHGLVDLTKRFAAWSQGLGQNKSFQGFLAYVRKEGPKVATFFGDLFVLAGKLITALAPLGAVAFGVISTIVGFLSKLSPGQLLAIGIALTGLFIAFKVGLIAVKLATLEEATAMGILNVVMDANPIGLVVLAIAALAAGFIYAFKHVKWFHDGVVAVWNALKTGVVAVIGFVKNHWLLILGILTGPIGGAAIFIVTHWRSITRAFSNAVGWVKDSFSNSWTAVRGFIVTPVRNAVSAVQDFFGKGGPLRTAFSNAITAIGNIWDGLKALAAKPINFIIDTVYNHGLAPALRLLPGINKKNLPDAQTIKLATGGVLPGYTPGRDVHTFVSPTGGTLHLSGGEAIMRPEWTRQNGGAAGVAKQNAAAIRGQRSFAGGGILGQALSFMNPSKWVDKLYNIGGYGPLLSNVALSLFDSISSYIKSKAKSGLGLAFNLSPAGAVFNAVTGGSRGGVLMPRNRFAGGGVYQPTSFASAGMRYTPTASGSSLTHRDLTQVHNNAASWYAGGDTGSMRPIQVFDRSGDPVQTAHETARQLAWG